MQWLALLHFMSRRFRSVVDWGLGFGCRFGPMRLLLGLLGFWSRQLLSGSGNPRCAVDSAPSAQLLSRLNRSHQLSPFSRALASVRQQQVSAWHSYPPQLNQPPLHCSQPLQLPTSAGLICLLRQCSFSAHLQPHLGHLARWVPPPAQNLPPILFRHLWLLCSAGVLG